jgi:hypothetical protein
LRLIGSIIGASHGQGLADGEHSGPSRRQFPLYRCCAAFIAHALIAPKWRMPCSPDRQPRLAEGAGNSYGMDAKLRAGWLADARLRQMDHESGSHESKFLTLMAPSSL